LRTAFEDSFKEKKKSADDSNALLKSKKGSFDSFFDFISQSSNDDDDGFDNVCTSFDEDLKAYDFDNNENEFEIISPSKSKEYKKDHFHLDQKETLHKKKNEGNTMEKPTDKQILIHIEKALRNMVASSTQNPSLNHLLQEIKHSFTEEENNDTKTHPIRQSSSINSHENELDVASKKITNNVVNDVNEKDFTLTSNKMKKKNLSIDVNSKYQHINETKALKKSPTSNKFNPIKSPKSLFQSQSSSTMISKAWNNLKYKKPSIPKKNNLKHNKARSPAGSTITTMSTMYGGLHFDHCLELE